MHGNKEFEIWMYSCFPQGIIVDRQIFAESQQETDPASSGRLNRDGGWVASSNGNTWIEVSKEYIPWIISLFYTKNDIMTSSNGYIFRVADPLCGELYGHRWIPLTKASDAELSCFLWSTPKSMVE